MSNWAIVIGVDCYPASASWNLNGAVRDALGMRSWLLDARGGNVPPEQLRLLLSPHAPLADPSVAYEAPTLTGIVRAIESLLGVAAAVTDRFYFYFSGHGLSARLDFSTQSAIVASDFTQEMTTNSLTVSSLFDLFLSTQFAEQYFFIDACRSMLPVDEVRLGLYPRPRRPAWTAPAQFVMYATQPGVKAREVGKPGDETGAFTGALLDGLRGNAAAKAWDPDSDQYVVRWSRLFAMVEGVVRARKLLADGRPGGPLIQIPKQFGERGSMDPEMGRFPKERFSPERLSINLLPAERVSEVARLRVNEMAGLAAELAPPHPSLPVVIALPPRTYSILAEADGYRTKRPSTTVDLYEGSTVTVEFVKIPSLALEGLLPLSPVDRLPRGSPEDGAGTREKGQSFGQITDALASRPALAPFTSPGQQGYLNVKTSDPLVLITVADESGRVVATERGRVFRSDLGYGYYRVRVLAPEGDVVSESVERPRAQAEPAIDLAFTREDPLLARPGSPAMTRLVKSAGFEVWDDGAISPSEAVGPTAFLKLSTALALAAGAFLERDTTPHGERLRTLPLVAFVDALDHPLSCGVYLVLGDERGAGYWRDVRVATSRAGEGKAAEERLEVQVGDVPGGDAIVWAAVEELTPGSHVLTLLFPATSVEIPFVVMANRATILAVTREEDETLELHQYMMPTAARGPGVGEVPPWQARDPDFSGANFPAIRRIEYMQRSFATGRMTPLAADVDLLLHDKWLDPIAGCLGAYIAIRTGHRQELGVATANLLRYFELVPDVHVLRGSYLEAAGDAPGARASYERSLLGGGVPLFRDGLRILADAAEALHLPALLQERTRTLLARTASGGSWSVVTTRKFDPPAP